MNSRKLLEAPPEVLSRCAKFFLEHGRSAKAAHLFILSKSYPRAMQIIIEEDVDMSPRMVELLNLPPGMWFFLAIKC